MQRRQVHVRVRTGSGEVIDALVLEWLSYPDRALVQLPSRQRPSVVRLNPTTDLYSPRSLPAPTPRLAIVVAGLVLGGVLLGFLVPASPPAQPVKAAALASRTPPPAPDPSTPPPVPPAQVQTSLPRASPKWVLPPPPASRTPAPITTSPARAPAKPSPPSPARYEAKLTALPSEAARRGAHACKCGATFHSHRELEAHQTGIAYSCIRYPACQVTASSPDAIPKHYEKERKAGGRCWFEAVRFGGSYAVVKRPKCRTLAANPNRRKVIRVRVKPTFMNDDNPWR